MTRVRARGGISVTGMSVQVTTQSNGASWSGSASSSTIQLKAQGASSLLASRKRIVPSSDESGEQ
jgi:hypothetical protein